MARTGPTTGRAGADKVCTLIPIWPLTRHGLPATNQARWSPPFPFPQPSRTNPWQGNYLFGRVVNEERRESAKRKLPASQTSPNLPADRSSIPTQRISHTNFILTFLCENSPIPSWNRRSTSPPASFYPPPNAKMAAMPAATMYPQSHVGFDSITSQIERKLLKRGFQFNIICVGKSNSQSAKPSSPWT